MVNRRFQDRYQFDRFVRTGTRGSPDQPEKPFFQRSQVQHQSVHSVCQNCHKETSNSIEEVVVRGRHDDKQDEEWIQEGDGTDRSMGRIEEEREASVNEEKKESIGYGIVKKRKTHMTKL